VRLGLALGVAGLPLPEYAAIAAAAERAGAAVICAGEVHHDSFVAAAVLSAATSTARVMTAVTTWARPPVSTAMAAMSVDELCAGRFVLGLGSMPPAWSRDHFGVDPTRPLDRMREYLSVIRATFAAHSGRRIEATGPHYPVTGWTRLAPPPRATVPVHLAVTRPDMAGLAGEIADGALFNVIITRSWLRERLLPALHRGAGRRPGGDRPELGAMVRVCLHDGSAEGRRRAHARLRRSLWLYAGVPYFHEVAAAAGVDASALSDSDLGLFGIVGTVAQAREALEQYGGAVDWLELVPPSFLTGAELRTEYDALLELIASAAPSPAVAAELQ
jgi:alkanesulfonate monooxygenase SsuD/methylene tetrahydromethanopterin reductase-like flavin-dependent oxidoreductase (luciferase family)